MLLSRINAYLFAIPADTLKTNLAVNQGKQRIVRTTANILSRMDVSAALANQNVACENELTISTLGAKTLRLRVTTVLGGAAALLMSKELQIDVHHRVTPSFLIF